MEIKQLTTGAIDYARKHLSEQTKWVHYYSKDSLFENHDTIPLVENALYALALFRSKNSSNMLEGKELVKRLLHFQSSLDDSKGNFPHYLHEFPYCQDPYGALRIFVPLYWILIEFAPLLGDNLKNRLTKSLQQSLSFSRNLKSQMTIGYSRSLQLASATLAMGCLLTNKEWKIAGLEELKRLSDISYQNEWMSPSEIGKILIAYQMASAHIESGCFAPFLKFVFSTWHQSLTCYAGPALKVLQFKDSPEIKLYDYYLSHFTKTLLTTDRNITISGLYAALIRPIDEDLESFSLPHSTSFVSGNKSGYLFMEKQYTCSLIDYSKIEENPHKGLHILRLLWKGKERVHSFAMQPENISVNVSKNLSSKNIEFLLHYDQCNQNENDAHELVASFYLDIHPDSIFTVEGKRSNTFQLNQKIRICNSNMNIGLTFSLSEGKGIFYGHLMRGNRPAQRLRNNITDFKAYDWVFYLRAVRLNTSCIVTGQLSLDMIEEKIV